MFVHFTKVLLQLNFALFQILSSKHQQDNYSYGRPATVTTYDNKQYYQTSIAPAQRTPTENYYQTGESIKFYSCAEF